MVGITFDGKYMHAKADSNLIFRGRRERRLGLIGQGSFVALGVGNCDDDDDYEFRSRLLI